MSRSRRPPRSPFAARSCWHCERRSCRCRRAGEQNAFAVDARLLAEEMEEDYGNGCDGCWWCFGYPDEETMLVDLALGGGDPRLRLPLLELAAA